MSAHSPSPPSSAARRVQCPASVLAEASVPEDDTPEAKEGTAAHWVLERAVMGGRTAVGAQAPNGVFVTDEMLRGAASTVAHIAAVLEPYGWAPNEGLSEQRVHVPRVSENQFGTPDYRIWLSEKHLFLLDYKYGHRPVEVKENAQLTEYVAGAMSTDCPDVHDLDVKVTCCVSQPRSFHRDGPIRTWSFKAADIRGHINIAKMAWEQAFAAEPPRRSGPECRDCRARWACPTLQASALAACDTAKGHVPLTCSTDEAGRELRLLQRSADLIKARITGLEARIESDIRAGKPVSNWSLERNASRKVWSVPAAAVAAVLGDKVRKPQEVITPTQAAQAGLDATLVASLTREQPGSSTLAYDDGSKARAIFGNTQ